MNASQMQRQIVVVNESFGAELTLERFVLDVRFLVTAQRTELIETSIANATFVRLDAGMNAKVFLQIVIFGKASITIGTWIRTFARVQSHVCDQFKFEIKRFVAHGARKQFGRLV